MVSRNVVVSRPSWLEAGIDNRHGYLEGWRKREGLGLVMHFIRV